MSEIKPHHLWCGHNLTVLISEHPKNKCLSQTHTFALIRIISDKPIKKGVGVHYLFDI